METLFRKVLVTERLPDKGDRYFTNDGIRVYSPHTKQFIFTHQAIEYWLEPVELPSEEEIQKVAPKTRCVYQFWSGANYILGFINDKK